MRHLFKLLPFSLLVACSSGPQQAPSYEPEEFDLVELTVTEHAADLAGMDFLDPYHGGRPLAANRASVWVSSHGELLMEFNNEEAIEHAKSQLKGLTDDLEAATRTLEAARKRDDSEQEFPSAVFDSSDFDKAVAAVEAAEIKVFAEAVTKKDSRQVLYVEDWTTGDRPARRDMAAELEAALEEAKKAFKAYNETLEKAAEEAKERVAKATEDAEAKNEIRRNLDGAIELWSQKRVQLESRINELAESDAGRADLMEEMTGLAESIELLSEEKVIADQECDECSNELEKEQAVSKAISGTEEAKEEGKNVLEALSRSLTDFLPNGRVVLEDSGLERGDGVILGVDVIRPGKAGGDKDVDEVVRIPLKLEDFGWRTHTRGSFIFHRAESLGGADKPWKANAAAMYEWGYVPRCSDWTADCVRALRPSFGFHIASVDLEEETEFEVGIGGNLTLFDGLLSFGYGHNLMAQRDYYFIGGNLFELVNTLRE